MPGLASIDRETVYLPHTRNVSRSSNPMCYQESQIYLSPEQIALAEESLSMYCKPVEWYKILQHRALKHPLFLQRSLSYKIQKKRQRRYVRQRRIKMTVKFSWNVSDEVPGKNFRPPYVFLSSPIDDFIEVSSFYLLTGGRLLRTTTQQGCNELSAVSFILPEIGKLSVDVDARNLTLLFVSFADHKIVSCGKASSPQLGQVLWGKVALGSLCSSWQKSPNLRVGRRVDKVYSVDLHSSNLEHDLLHDGTHIFLRTPTNTNGLNSVTRLQIIISAQEVGPRDGFPYDSYSYSDIPLSSQLQINDLRAGNVIFNYKYYNNSLQKTEAREDFSCPFCLLRCASFKGLQLHLNSWHDLFNFEFLVTEDYHSINVSLKNEIWRYEGNIPGVDGSDIRFKDYFFCRALQKRQFLHSHRAQGNIPGVDGSDKRFKGYFFRRALQKRQFFHSHRAQWKEDVFAPLNDDEEGAVACALKDGNSEEVLVMHTNSNIEIRKRLLRCLLPDRCLNDEVINLYLELLKEREKREPGKFLKCHFFKTFFYNKLDDAKRGYDYKAVRNWTAQKIIGYSLMDCKKIFVPIHKDFHWCLAVIDMEAKKFQYLDSLRGSGAHVLDVLVRYIRDEAKDKTGQDLDVSSWETQLVEDLPQQENGSDCGMFMIKYADFHSRGLPLSFLQKHMPYFRKRTAKEILGLKAE